MDTDFEEWEDELAGSTWDYHCAECARIMQAREMDS